MNKLTFIAATVLLMASSNAFAIGSAAGQAGGATGNGGYGGGDGTGMSESGLGGGGGWGGWSPDYTQPTYQEGYGWLNWNGPTTRDRMEFGTPDENGLYLDPWGGPSLDKFPNDWQYDASFGGGFGGGYGGMEEGRGGD